MEKIKNRFLLKEWEIWHTYSTYLNIGYPINLIRLSKKMVDTGFSHLSQHISGFTVWKYNNELKMGITSYSDTDDSDVYNFTLKSLNENEEVKIKDFAIEAWGQCSYFRSNELRLFNKDSLFPILYTRAFIGQCILYKTQNNERILLYPIVTVYVDGIITVEFRTISPDRYVNLKDFIDGAVNLGIEYFDAIQVPPGLSKLASESWVRSQINWKIYERPTILEYEKKHESTIIAGTILDKSGDFNFELSPLSKAEDRQKESLSSLALTIFNSVAYLISNSPKGLKYILFGNPIISEIGYWFGRPHIYLCKFNGQQNISSKNENLYKEHFAHIMLRSSKFPSNIALEHLPTDSRYAEDYSAYIGITASLWVWSKMGLERTKEYIDANRGHLIYEQQATIRLLEYSYLLYRKMYDKSYDIRNIKDVINARKELISLEQYLEETSKFGEIRNLIQNGLNELGVQNIKNRIDELLKIKEFEVSNRDRRTAERIGRTITIIFGLIAIPTIANDILKPLWFLIDAPLPKTEDSIDLFFIGLTATMIAIILIFVLRIFKNSDS